MLLYNTNVVTPRVALTSGEIWSVQSHHVRDFVNSTDSLEGPSIDLPAARHSSLYIECRYKGAKVPISVLRVDRLGN